MNSFCYVGSYKAVVGCIGLVLEHIHISMLFTLWFKIWVFGVSTCIFNNSYLPDIAFDTNKIPVSAKRFFIRRYIGSVTTSLVLNLAM